MEARALGRGGVSAMAWVNGLARSTGYHRNRKREWSPYYLAFLEYFNPGHIFRQRAS
jgi:hypothetical protein